MRTFHYCAAFALALACGCNTGTRDGDGKPAFGPGSTGSKRARLLPPSGTSAAGSFSAIGSLSEPRAQHTATLLPDGRVLVTGGWDGAPVQSSEVFDPGSSTWTLTSDLAPTPDEGLMLRGGQPTARRLHTAVLLADGRVLVAGGHGRERGAGGEPESLVSCYTFDPQTHAFSAAGDLRAARSRHQGAALRGGGALITGGVTHPGAASPLRTAERFDPRSGTWTAFDAGTGRTAGVAVELTGAGPLIYGGGHAEDYAGGVLVLSDLSAPAPQVYDARGGDLQTGPSSSLVGGPRVDVGGVATSDGGAAFAGGRVLSAPASGAAPYLFDSSWDYVLVDLGSASEVVDTTERYRAAQGVFVPGPRLTIPRYGARCAELGATGEVLVVGGLDARDAPLATCEVWATASDAILGTVDLTTPRFLHTATALRDGRVLVVGGLDDARQGLVGCEVYAR